MFSLFRKNLTGFQLATAERSSRGGRETNQDSCFSGWTQRGLLLAVMADGLGGHAGGEVASRLAVEAVRGHVAEVTPETAGQELPLALRLAHQSILEQARQDARLAQMKSTCVAVLLAKGEMLFAAVGDSRLYHFRESRPIFMTRDQSVAQLLVDSGQLTQEEALRHPDRHRLYQALGMDGEVRVQEGDAGVALQPGDALLLCTDGFWQYMDAEAAARGLCEQSGTARQRLDKLFGMVAGAAAQCDPRHDNMSALVVCVT